MEENTTEYIMAILNCDKDKIKAFCKRDNIYIPENEEVFWAGVHKTRCTLTMDFMEKYKESKEWLERHNYEIPTKEDGEK